MKTRLAVIVTVSVLGAVGSLAALGPPTEAQDAFTRQGDVKVPMSDGVNLAVDIYVPTQGTRFPAILIRTPYNKKGNNWFAKELAARGYAVVLQDVRGKGASAGEFYPIVQEKKDGLDTLDWIASQPWCDGNIGMWGPSYVGFCALILAPESHPNLKTIFQLSGWGDSPELVAPGGALHLQFALAWSLTRQIHGSGSFSDHDWPSAFRITPVSDIPRRIGVDSKVWPAMIRDWVVDAAQKKASIAGKYDRIGIPILHLSGWNDFLARHTLDTYVGIDAAGDARGKRVFQKLLLGPWGHDGYWSVKRTKVGDEEFGPAAAMGSDRIIELSARWFDRWLKGVDNGITREKPVKLFVMGKNVWREFDRWPPRGVEIQKWYFDSNAGANSLSGDGRLATTLPNEKGADTFVYDPMNPVPTTGGVNFHHFRKTLGPRDQRSVEQRRDVLVYTSEPLAEDLTIIGPLKALIYAATEGRHTDFTAKLVEVRPDGYARVIEDGIRRGPDSTPIGSIEPIEPGKVYRYTIDLGKTAISIHKGDRLRVEISSSNFPKYSRNPNTGELPEQATKFEKVEQTVLHSIKHPSHVVLPILK